MRPLSARFRQALTTSFQVGPTCERPRVVALVVRPRIGAFLSAYCGRARGERATNILTSNNERSAAAINANTYPVSIGMGGGPGDGAGDGAGGRGGDGAGGRGSGDGEGGNGKQPLPTPLAWIPGIAVLSYIGLLVAAANAWDALLDASIPRQDMRNATVSVIIPVLNEERIIAETVRHVLQDLQPPPYEVIVVDGGSTDGTAAAAVKVGARLVRSGGRGRGLQMNAGAAAARGAVLLFLHADTRLPGDAVAEVRSALSAPRTVLVGFRPLIEDGGRPMWASSLNNLAKTWYGPLLLRPASFVRGLRVVFGDQALSCRAADLRHAGGYRPDIPFMEDAELCLHMHMAGPARRDLHAGRGRVRMLMHRAATTSGRRIAAWGELRANWVFARVALMWLAGATPAQLHSCYRELYPDVR
ncbi:hypothetical protein Agub_g14594 [Astrephomene gubernaculifera]|uniref:Glycosyltransferase 2-like domain-containing protein n=1 Tax=Astrephomene gubernaculifera TaxID=47775 RepID=A0AAD3HT76_9CHLO|nr:hypothetical protein Agub_g14594 [Astrephomene gubernaculifera]